MAPALTESYAYCRALARRAGNFYYAFWSLPADQYWAMCALYGFTRLVDDAGDDPDLSLAERQTAVATWRLHLDQALAGQTGGHIVLPALADTVRRYQIPHDYLYALIRGVESDLTPVTYQTYEELQAYCYHVAGVVGLCCIHIWGFHDARALTAAVVCGEAFQLTNILRDLQEDQQNGRCYLPDADLQAVGYSSTDIAAGVRDERFRELMRLQVARAHALYVEGAEVSRYLSPTGRPIFDTMVRLYRGLLTEIERRDFDVYSERVRLSRWTKLRFAGYGFLRGLWVRARSCATPSSSGSMNSIAQRVPCAEQSASALQASMARRLK